MRIIMLVLAISCTSISKREVYYLVTTDHTVYRCSEYHHGAYGASALDCLDLSTSEHIDLIANPYNIKEVEK
jgi:uncharacterized protein YceK